MPRKKKEETLVEPIEEVVDTKTKETSSYEPLIKMGKRPQTRSLLTNPRSKWYNPKIAKRRAKEKNRRKVNQLKRK